MPECAEGGVYDARFRMEVVATNVYRQSFTRPF
jgi:hypothetical protein